MHINPWQINPPANQPYTHATPLYLPCQLTIDPCNTVTPHKSQIVNNAHIPMADPYTKAVSHIGECHGRQTPKLRIDALNTVTPNIAHLLLQSTPQSIKHRCFEYHYTKFGRSTATEGVLCKRPFTCKGNYLVILVWNNTFEKVTFVLLDLCIMFCIVILKSDWNSQILPKV